MVRQIDIREASWARQDQAAMSAASSEKTHTADPSICPRCAARLLFDGAQLACLMCGFERAAPGVRLRSPGDLLDALPVLRINLIGYAESLGTQPEAGSPAARALQSADEVETAALGFGRLYAYQCLTAAGQGLIALARGLEPPAPEYGTWSIAKTVLDSSSLACWLLESDIPRRQRARRALALQVADVEAQDGFLRTLLAERPDDGLAAGFGELLSETRATRAGLAAAVDGLGGTVDIPGPADRARLLDAAVEHLVCSSVLEGRPWALLRAASIRSSARTATPEGIITTQVQLSASWYARAVWTYVRWMSRESLPELQSALESGYDSLGLPDDPQTRFWRRPAPALADRGLGQTADVTAQRKNGHYDDPPRSRRGTRGQPGRPR